MVRLAILTSHPIQYNAPFFRSLSEGSDIDLCVFYCWEGTQNQPDPEFEKTVTWDIPLLSGYNYRFVPNAAKQPGTHHFSGIDNPGMIGEIENWHPDAILVYGWSFKTNLNVMRYFHGKIPVYFRGDSTLLTGGGYVRMMLRRLWLRYVYKHVDIAFYPGQRSRDYFLSNGLRENQLKWVPHSVENPRFLENKYTLEDKAKEERRKLGIPADAIVFLFAGKLVLRKQPELLLKAVSDIVKNAKKEIHLIFAGTGPLLKQLKTLAADSKYIHFIGFKNQSEMPLTYRLGDVFVLPSTVETWGLAVNEAMASGRPVIASNLVGCAIDLVEPGVTGDVFNASDIESLKQVISQYVENPGRSEAMGRQAELKIHAWSIDEAARIMADFIVKDVTERTR